jgi:hypothetical protein
MVCLSHPPLWVPSLQFLNAWYHSVTMMYLRDAASHIFASTDLDWESISGAKELKQRGTFSRLGGSPGDLEVTDTRQDVYGMPALFFSLHLGF